MEVTQSLIRPGCRESLSASFIIISFSSILFSFSSEEHVKEEVDRGVEDDKGVRDVVDVDQPVWPSPEHGGVVGGRVEGLVGGGHEAPGVAGHEQGHDGQGDARQAVLLATHHRVLPTAQGLPAATDADATAASSPGEGATAGTCQKIDK